MPVSLTTITIPTPEPFDRSAPTKQQENYYYVWLQLLAAMKQAGELVSLNPTVTTGSVSIDLTTLVEAVNSLRNNGQTIDLGIVKIIQEGQTLSVAVP